MAGRRSNGEGSVQKLKSGTWRDQVMNGYTEGSKITSSTFLVRHAQQFWRRFGRSSI